jgi:tetratricopeptide (TPR) repeat protein
MILRLSDSLSRGLIVAVALGVAAVLSFFAVRMALAASGAEEESAKGLRLATRLEPKNPEYWYRLGHYQQFNLEQPDSSEAEEYFKKAIALDPNYTDAWLDLGTSYELDGDFDAAREAYAGAKKSYPTSAEVSWRYGNFLLRQGDVQAAYPEFHRSLEIDPRRAASAFSRSFRANPDIEEILDKVLPPVPSVYVDVIAEAATAKQIALSEIVWKRLLALHPRLTVRDVEPLVGALLADGETVEARRIWDEGTAAMYLPALLGLPGSLIWDASFESGISSGTFAWHILPIAQGVTTAFDTSEKLSGNQSLRLSFDGKINPNIEAACAPAIVTSNTNYHFSAWIKTKNLTTNHGVGFHIHSYNHSKPESPIVSSRTISGTNAWTFVDLPYVSGRDGDRVLVCVSRERDLDSDVHISGTAWVDDVNLVPANAEPPKP